MQMIAGQSVGPMQRRMRSPTHPFNVRVAPFQVRPHFIAQVIPGETLKGANITFKAFSDPVKNTLIGCRLEQMYYYIPLRFLDGGDKFKEMVVDPAYDAVSEGLTATTDNVSNYFASSATLPGIDYVQLCLDHVTQEYFRDEDETPGSYLVDGHYGARIRSNTVTQSLATGGAYDLLDPDVDEDGDGTITAGEVSRAFQSWQQLVQSGRVQMSYADYLRSYGIKEAREEILRAQEIRTLSEWTEPTRLVDPATGTPVAAWSWKVQDRIDKARFFKEPGFIFGVTVVRPKVYLSNLQGTTLSYLQSALAWLPGEAINSLAYGLPNFAAGTGPIGAASAAYALDLRDLLQYGEQYVNFALTEPGEGLVAAPALDASSVDRVSYADVQSLFAGAKYDIHAEGVVSLRIASHLGKDLTPDA